MKYLGVAAKIGLSLVLIWFAARQIDIGRAWGAIDPRPAYLAGAVLALLGTLVVGGLRWWGLLRAHGVVLSRRRAAALTVLSQFFNSALPSTVGGDAVRAYYAVQRGDAAGAIWATVLDRVSGLASVAAVSLLVLFLEPFGLRLPPLWRTSSALVGVGVGAVLAALFVYRSYAGTIATWTQRLRPRFRWIGEQRVDAAAAVTAMLWSVPILGCVSVALAMASLGAGIPPISLGLALAIAAPLMLASGLPISAAGWGVREVVVVKMFEAMNLPGEEGLIISVLYGLCLTCAGAPGLFVWLYLRRTTAPLATQALP